VGSWPRPPWLLREREGHPGYREIKVKLYVKADAQREVLERIWAETLETSPVANSLTRVVSLTPELSIV
jgi:uncharacterized OsmC-like protein